MLDAEAAADHCAHPGRLLPSHSATSRSRDVKVARSQVLPGVRLENVRDLAAMLAAAEAAAIAAWCSQTAADYARTRQQFGRPIGSFQAIKHLCAGMACRSEQATAIAWDAARAADQAPAELPLAAAAAAALALDAAVDNAKDAIQVLGGIGFTWEHDAHLYLRRALALRQLLGGSRPVAGARGHTRARWPASPPAGHREGQDRNSFSGESYLGVLTRFARPLAWSRLPCPPCRPSAAARRSPRPATSRRAGPGLTGSVRARPS